MTNDVDRVEVTAEEYEGGLRLDKFLAQRLSDVSRSRLQDLIRQGHVTFEGGALCDPNTKVVGGGQYEVMLPAPASYAPLPQAIPLDVVYEDQHLIVIDKPAGLVVHPSAGHEDGTLVNALIQHCGESLSGIGGVKRPGIVHRIDKETSGLLVVAKTDAAHQGLSTQFAAHGRDGRLHRVYTALVWGVPLRPKGKIDARLGRSVTNRKKIAVVGDGQGRSAVTHYFVERKFGEMGKEGVAQLRLELETGRTHQIRVHLAHIGHPLLGDMTYGGGFKSRANTLAEPVRVALEALGRQALHASELGFEHPVTGTPLTFVSDLPKDMVRLIDSLES